MHPAINPTVLASSKISGPPLAGSEWVTANPEPITEIIFKGLKGESVVKGEKYGTSAAS